MADMLCFPQVKWLWHHFSLSPLLKDTHLRSPARGGDGVPPLGSPQPSRSPPPAQRLLYVGPAGPCSQQPCTGWTPHLESWEARSGGAAEAGMETDSDPAHQSPLSSGNLPTIPLLPPPCSPSDEPRGPRERALGGPPCKRHPLPWSMQAGGRFILLPILSFHSLDQRASAICP